ncbi:MULTISPECIES: hypothetical protein [Pseudomonas]|uniref:hypothetical protein n=1 Tax=Pseudomonas TaxID=286 RepID=UPI0030EFA993
MTSNSSVDTMALAICDRLCLNHDLYLEFKENPMLVINKFVLIAAEQSLVLKQVQKKMDKVKLEAHWKNQVSCACRDVYYQLPV